MSLRIAIITDEPGWHGRRLRKAFEERGLQSAYVSLTDAAIRLGRRAMVRLPGFDEALPDAVFVRGVPGGSLEQVVFHLNVLHALKDLGVPVYNDGRAIERSVDKCLTSLRLHHAGIPTPETWVCRSHEQAISVVRKHAWPDQPLVCKPLFGSQGQGVELVRAEADLPDSDAVNGVWYLQRFVGVDPQRAEDWRVFVVGGKAIAAMRRAGDGWLANVAQGARCHPVLLEGLISRLAEQAAATLNMDYAGVDLIRDGNGRWWLIEVNSIPAWHGLQSVTSVDIAAHLADGLLSRLAPGGNREVQA